jgi:type I restriction enzyme S subunit
LLSARYPNIPLKNVVAINPRTNFRNVEDDTLLSFVPMEAISDEEGGIVSVQKRAFSENIGYTNFQERDLLWAKITPCMENGKSAVAEGLLNGYGFGSTEYHVFRVKMEAVDIHFIYALLRLKRLRKAATNYFGGSSGHQRVDDLFFKQLVIPLPDIKTQRRLLEHIRVKRDKAKRLQKQAEAVLKSAKQTVEKLILGEA